MTKVLLFLLGGIFLFPWGVWAETAAIIDKQNEFSGCTVEVSYDKKDMTREHIDWIRSLHYFDHRWELRKSIDFYPNRKESTDRDRARRVILFDPTGKEQSVTYHDWRGQVIERMVFE